MWQKQGHTDTLAHMHTRAHTYHTPSKQNIFRKSGGHSDTLALRALPGHNSEYIIAIDDQIL